MRRGFAGTTGRSLFPLTPAKSTAIFSWIWTIRSGSLSSDFGTGLNGMAGMCVDISTRFRDCVGPVDPLFGLLIVTGLRYGQRSPLFVWYVCFCRITVFRIHLEDPVTALSKQSGTKGIIHFVMFGFHVRLACCCGNARRPAQLALYVYTKVFGTVNGL